MDSPQTSISLDALGTFECDADCTDFHCRLPHPAGRPPPCTKGAQYALDCASRRCGKLHPIVQIDVAATVELQCAGDDALRQRFESFLNGHKSAPSNWVRPTAGKINAITTSLSSGAAPGTAVCLSHLFEDKCVQGSNCFRLHLVRDFDPPSESDGGASSRSSSAASGVDQEQGQEQQQQQQNEESAAPMMTIESRTESTAGGADEGSAGMGTAESSWVTTTSSMSGGKRSGKKKNSHHHHHHQHQPVVCCVCMDEAKPLAAPSPTKTSSTKNSNNKQQDDDDDQQQQAHVDYDADDDAFEQKILDNMRFLGVFCNNNTTDEPHFTCCRCLSHLVTKTWATLEPEPGGAAPALRCPGVDCATSAPFTQAQVCRFANEDAVTVYLKIQDRAREAKALADAQELVSKLTKESASKTAEIEKKLLEEQLRRQFPNAWSCPRCLFAPILHEACSDLMTHAGDDGDQFTQRRVRGGFGGGFGRGGGGGGLFGGPPRPVTAAATPAPSAFGQPTAFRFGAGGGAATTTTTAAPAAAFGFGGQQQQQQQQQPSQPAAPYVATRRAFIDNRCPHCKASFRNTSELARWDGKLRDVSELLCAAGANEHIKPNAFGGGAAAAAAPAAAGGLFGRGGGMMPTATPAGFGIGGRGRGAGGLFAGGGGGPQLQLQLQLQPVTPAAVNELADLTGLPSDLARRHLQNHGGNMTDAANAFFDNEPGVRQRLELQHGAGGGTGAATTVTGPITRTTFAFGRGGGAAAAAPADSDFFLLGRGTPRSGPSSASSSRASSVEGPRQSFNFAGSRGGGGGGLFSGGRGGGGQGGRFTSSGAPLSDAVIALRGQLSALNHFDDPAALAAIPFDNMTTPQQTVRTAQLAQAVGHPVRPTFRSDIDFCRAVRGMTLQQVDPIRQEYCRAQGIQSAALDAPVDPTRLVHRLRREMSPAEAQVRMGQITAAIGRDIMMPEPLAIDAVRGCGTDIRTIRAQFPASAQELREAGGPSPLFLRHGAPSAGPAVGAAAAAAAAPALLRPGLHQQQQQQQQPANVVNDRENNSRRQLLHLPPFPHLAQMEPREMTPAQLQVWIGEVARALGAAQPPAHLPSCAPILRIFVDCSSHDEILTRAETGGYPSSMNRGPTNDQFALMRLPYVQLSVAQRQVRLGQIVAATGEAVPPAAEAAVIDSCRGASGADALRRVAAPSGGSQPLRFGALGGGSAASLARGGFGGGGGFGNGAPPTQPGAAVSGAFSFGQQRHDQQHREQTQWSQGFAPPHQQQQYQRQQQQQQQREQWVQGFAPQHQQYADPVMGAFAARSNTPGGGGGGFGAPFGGWSTPALVAFASGGGSANENTWQSVRQDQIRSQVETATENAAPPARRMESSFPFPQNHWAPPGPGVQPPRGGWPGE